MTNLLDTLASDAYDFARSHSYIALDVPSLESAKALVELFGEAVDGYKVGLELFHAAGMRVVERLVRDGKRVFFDVKLHDIPNTVAGALRVLRDSGIDMVNVHALGGPKMLEAARNALEGSTDRPQLIAVTVLTSLGDDALHQMQLPSSSALVPQLAQLAYHCGLDGVVASALDIEAIYTHVPASFVSVVPGTRPAGADVHDQVRTRTPGQAIASGATHLVIGRAVTQAASPLAALKSIWDEMERARTQRVDTERSHTSYE